MFFFFFFGGLVLGSLVAEVVCERRRLSKEEEEEKAGREEGLNCLFCDYGDKQALLLNEKGAWKRRGEVSWEEVEEETEKQERKREKKSQGRKLPPRARGICPMAHLLIWLIALASLLLILDVFLSLITILKLLKGESVEIMRSASPTRNEDFRCSIRRACLRLRGARSLLSSSPFSLLFLSSDAARALVFSRLPARLALSGSSGGPP